MSKQSNFEFFFNEFTWIGQDGIRLLWWLAYVADRLISTYDEHSIRRSSIPSLEKVKGAWKSCGFGPCRDFIKHDIKFPGYLSKIMVWYKVSILIYVMFKRGNMWLRLGS